MSIYLTISRYVIIVTVQSVSERKNEWKTKHLLCFLVLRPHHSVSIFVVLLKTQGWLCAEIIILGFVHRIMNSWMCHDGDESSHMHLYHNATNTPSYRWDVSFKSVSTVSCSEQVPKAVKTTPWVFWFQYCYLESEIPFVWKGSFCCDDHENWWQAFQADGLFFNDQVNHVDTSIKSKLFY